MPGSTESWTCSVRITLDKDGLFQGLGWNPSKCLAHKHKEWETKVSWEQNVASHPSPDAFIRQKLRPWAERCLPAVKLSWAWN